MLGLKLRDEFLQASMRGTVINLKSGDNTGAIERSASHILSITYPTADVQTALRAISQEQGKQRPIVLMGSRGRGKSHIMAVLHHAVGSANEVQEWARIWGERPGLEALSTLTLPKGFYPITEAVHNHEYKFLWDLLFDRHPQGQYFRGKFDSSGHYYPSRSLLEAMFATQPVVLILDEFQKWFDGLPPQDAGGRKLLEWASNFIQNLSEIASERSDLLILVVSVLNNNTEAFGQIHRNTPLLIDFSSPESRRDRQKMVLYRLFQNREQIPSSSIHVAIDSYAQERFRLRFSHLPDVERDRITREVVESWPFAPELMELVENDILMAESAQDARDLIRILAEVYRLRGDAVPLITPADFFVDETSGGVQSLLDSIATVGEQERLREVAQRNLENMRSIGADSVHARELISALWMRSMSPGRRKGGTGAELQLDITRSAPIDGNAFQSELNHLIENSINIHGDSGLGGYLYFGLEENPRTNVRASARNDKLWTVSGMPALPGMVTYPGKDIEYIQKTLNHLLNPETKQAISRVIVLGPQWRNNPWTDIVDADKPNNWNQPVLIVIPEGLKADNHGHIEALGEWLKDHVKRRRNTVRFLLSSPDSQSIYTDRDLIFLARCSYLTAEAWKGDSTYTKLRNDFEKPLRTALFNRFERFAILRHWNYPSPMQCIFDLERISSQGNDLAHEVDQKIAKELFDPARFRSEVEKWAKDSWTVGALLDELAEPPTSPDVEAFPFLGDRDTYERVLEIAAKGHIALNVDGKWHTRPANAVDDEQAKRELNNKAFRSGPEMRTVLLGLPNEVGSATIMPPQPVVLTGVAPVTPVPLPTGGNNLPQIPGLPQLPTLPTGPGIAVLPPTQPSLPSVCETTPDYTATADGSTLPLNNTAGQKREQAADNTGINLSSNFERWGIAADQHLDAARLEFKNITAQQMKQILQRIPPQFRAALEVIYSEADEL